MISVHIENPFKIAYDVTLNDLLPIISCDTLLVHFRQNVYPYHYPAASLPGTHARSVHNVHHFVLYKSFCYYLYEVAVDPLPVEQRK